MEVAGNNHSAMAEALNNLAFASIARMDYKLAESQLDSVNSITDNQIELLIADVQSMRLCQRRAKNREFYSYKEKARKRIGRINEERASLDERSQKRLLYATTEYAFVTSTYYYYVGLEKPSRDALKSVELDGLMQNDTAQYLNLLYQYGSGGMIEGRSKNATLQEEYDKLLECFLMARRKGYVYWQANAMQSLSEHLVEKGNLEYILKNNTVSVGYLNPDNMSDSLLAGYLAQKSLDMFMEYGDVYQTAGSFRSLAQCFWTIGDNRSSLACLDRALTFSLRISQAPDLVASIREQLSIVYSSMNDKYNSDLNRNIYLDMQERTRQDMELDARAEQLDRTSRTLNLMIFFVTLFIVVNVVLICVLLRKKRRTGGSLKVEGINGIISRQKQNNNQIISCLEDRIEELMERRGILLLDIDRNMQRNVENRARIFLVDSVVPLIDRMNNEVEKLLGRNEDEETRGGRFEYISELAEKIDEYNDVLTQWIQLNKGDIGIRVETFCLSGIFDMISRSRSVFSLDGITLNVEPTSLEVKADRILTLFMINTLADNARKFTPCGGKVDVWAEEKDNCVEISVADTGKGMDVEELSKVFDRSIVQGHGFGLINCKGILNKYKKVSTLFNTCDIAAESTLGKGSRFFFRLPKGGRKMVVFLLFCLGGAGGLSALADKGVANRILVDDYLQEAKNMADSAYYSNVRGTYDRTVMFADSACRCLNRHYLSSYPKGHALMRTDVGDGVADAAEIEWFHRGVNTDYNIILNVRNEWAVAALALHQWDVYHYNNEIYTKLFKEVSADSSLAVYCRIMQRSEVNKNVAIVMLVILFVVLLAVGYVLYYRRSARRHGIYELGRSLEGVLVGNMSLEDKLAALHELSGSRFADVYGAELESALQELEKAAGKKKECETEISALLEEISRMEFEKNRLYVSNNILENCLSTIKHETMYYPSRICQCVRKQDDIKERDEVLRTVNDLVSYYKSLYTVLCEQAHSQLSANQIRCTPVDLTRYVREECSGVLVDMRLFRYLLDVMKRQNSGIKPALSLVGRKGCYVRISVGMSEVAVDEEKCSRLFEPSVGNIPYLLCRQVVREFCSATNLFGCGLTATCREGRLWLTVTLPCLKMD